MTMKRSLLLTLLIASLAPASALAQEVPTTISFHARLSADGAPTNESHDLVFRLFDAADGGTMLWTESAPDAEITDGVVARQLGATTPLTAAIFDGSAR